MAKIGNYSINPKTKNVSFDKFKKLVGAAFLRVDKKNREKEMKKAYEKQYGKIKTDSDKSKEDKSPKDSRKEYSKE